MWFRVDHKRQSRAQKFIVRCMAEMAGSRVAEEREVKGTTAARKTAEILASSLNVTATVYGTDADGEFVYGVFEVAESAAGATSAVIKKLFAESAAASLTSRISCSPTSQRNHQRLRGHVGGAWLHRHPA